MNILEIGKDCVGCGSCEHSCSHKAITLRPDMEGFYYPIIDNTLCVDCSLCYKSCPQVFHTQELGHQRNIVQFPYNVISRLKRYYKKSASGAVFVTIAHKFLQKYKNAVVCGAAYSEGRIHHILVDKIGDLYKLQGSKYVQSQLDDVYPRIKRHLKSNQPVLFSGTPCQVAGLYAYLHNRNIENLYTMDIICHGVPSPKFFNKDLGLYAANNSEISSVQFRKKHPLFKSRSLYFLTIVKKHKPCVSMCFRKSSLNLKLDPYFSLFSKGWTLRRSCYQCHYSNLQRVGDITIGDCDSHVNYPSFHPHEATSVVIINTVAGINLWERTSQYFDFINLDIQKEAEVNVPLRESFKCPPERETIYEEINRLPIQEIKKRYAQKKTMRTVISAFLIDYCPPIIINKFVKLIR